MSRKNQRAKLELGKLALSASFSEENYEEYSGAFLKLREEKLGALQRRIFANLGINIYENVKEAMIDRENVEVLNTAGSFDILFEEPEDALKKLLAALEKDAGLCDLIKNAMNDSGGGEVDVGTSYIGL